jgi:hypothetical protein
MSYDAIPVIKNLQGAPSTIFLTFVRDRVRGGSQPEVMDETQLVREET